MRRGTWAHPVNVIDDLTLQVDQRDAHLHQVGLEGVVELRRRLGDGIAEKGGLLVQGRLDPGVDGDQQLQLLPVVLQLGPLQLVGVGGLVGHVDVLVELHETLGDHLGDPLQDPLDPLDVLLLLAVGGGLFAEHDLAADLVEELPDVADLDLPAGVEYRFKEAAQLLVERHSRAVGGEQPVLRQPLDPPFTGELPCLGVADDIVAPGEEQLQQGALLGEHPQQVCYRQLQASVSLPAYRRPPGAAASAFVNFFEE